MEVLKEARNIFNIAENGFSVLDNVYSEQEVAAILREIEMADQSKETFRKSSDLFAIRRFLIEVPSVHTIIFNTALRSIIKQVFGNDYFVVKSIYFDKPPASNWFVAYHQDLTISVERRIEIEGFGPWTIKQGQYGVQAPITVLEKNFTIRIHLDDTNENNGALRVIQGSHLKGIYRPETIDRTREKEVSCNVSRGGVMIMRPLLLHSSRRTTNNSRRRVIHIEFSNQKLPGGLQWWERSNKAIS